jgi:hypothetical protein
MRVLAMFQDSPINYEQKKLAINNSRIYQSIIVIDYLRYSLILFRFHFDCGPPFIASQSNVL